MAVLKFCEGSNLTKPFPFLKGIMIDLMIRMGRKKKIMMEVLIEVAMVDIHPVVEVVEAKL